MPNRFRLLRPLVSAAAIVLLAACGGGGGGSSSTPAPSPTVSPVPVGTIATGTANLASGGSGSGSTGQTTFSINSNPQGLSVTVGGAPATTNGGSANITPLTGFTPLQSVTNGIPVVFNGTYTVYVQQTLSGPRSLFYNQIADSSGTLNLSSVQGLARRTDAIASTSDVRRPIARRRGSELIANRLTVHYAPSALATAQRSVTAIERSLGVSGRDLPAAGDVVRAVTVPAGQSTDGVRQALLATPGVTAVDAVYRRRLLSRAPATVNDPAFVSTTEQWYLNTTGAPFAWAYSTGSPAVRIAIIDTGIDDSITDLASKVDWEERVVSPTDALGNVTGTPVMTTGPNSAIDTNGHGTNVAGVAAATTNNAIGFAGAGDQTHLFVYDIFSDTDSAGNAFADPGDEAIAIKDAVDRGVDVISLSLGSDSADAGEQSAIQYAIAHGVTVVAAAGNDADGTEDGIAHAGFLSFPSAYDGVISAGASAILDNDTGTYATSSEYVPSYSQYSPGLAVVAPGGDTFHSGNSSQSDNLHWIENYSSNEVTYAPYKCQQTAGPTCSAQLEGTSQATPQVSAAAALLIAQAGGHGSLTPAKVLQLIEDTADNIGDAHQGHGRLNMYRALAGYLHDTSASTGPSTTLNHNGAAQFVAFAYNNSGSNRPAMLDVNFPAGVAVGTTGTFRIADVPPTAGTYRVAVWYDANANGYIDAGDQFGVASVTCSATAPCAIGTINASTVGPGFVLP